MLMRRRFIEPILLSLLLPLLATLAILQISWVRKAAAADRERMAASLERAAKQLVGSITDELSVLQLLFQLSPEDLASGSWSNLRIRWSYWRERSPYADLVRGVVLLSTAGGKPRAQWFDPDRGRIAPVPDVYTPEVTVMLARLFPAGAGRDALMFSSAGFLDVPAVVMPVYDKTPEGLVADAYVGLLLDRGVLGSQVLPALVADAFSGDIDGRDYQVVLLDMGSSRAVYPPGAETAAGLGARPDLLIPVAGSFTKLMLVSKGAAGTAEAPPRGLDVLDALTWMKLRRAGAVATDFSRGPVVDYRVTGTPGNFLFSSSSAAGGWLLSVTHRAGSLERAVTGIMMRNLAVSLGILVVLAASLAMLYLSFRRARAATQRQREFVATVSHELRTPLAVIYSAGENLSDGLVKEEGRVRGYGEVIRREGRRLRDMVEKVLTLSREQGAAPGTARAGWQEVDLGELVREAAALQEERCAALGIRLAVDVPDDAPRVNGDAAALRAAVRNLLDNAVIHGGSGGLVRIALSSRGGRRGREARVAVSDKGQGIPRRDLARLFEPFTRGDAAVAAQAPGSGLGLAIARRAVTLHGGEVTVESSPGEGSTFTIVLPLSGGAGG